MGNIWNTCWLLPSPSSLALFPQSFLPKGNVMCQDLVQLTTSPKLLGGHMAHSQSAHENPTPSFNPTLPGPGCSSAEVFLVVGAVFTLTFLCPFMPFHSLCDCESSTQSPVLKPGVLRAGSALGLGAAHKHIPPEGHSSSPASAAAEGARDLACHSHTYLKTLPGRRSSVLQAQIILNP